MRALFILPTLVALIALVALPTAALAAPSAATAPSEQPEQVEKLLATCVKVKGMVQYAPIGADSADTKAWKHASVLLTKCLFGNGQNEHADMRLLGGRGKIIYIRNLSLAPAERRS